MATNENMGISISTKAFFAHILLIICVAQALLDHIGVGTTS